MAWHRIVILASLFAFLLQILFMPAGYYLASFLLGLVIGGFLGVGVAEEVYDWKYRRRYGR